MTITELRKIIYEEVIKAMRAEFREILTEAVQAAETPEVKTTRSYFTETKGKAPITALLQETAQNMNSNDLKAFIGTTTPVQKSTEVPDIISTAMSKAKAVLDASNLKDRERYGL